MPASLLGTFAGADANGVTSIVTGARTTTAGSLVTVGGAAWKAGGTQTLSTTDSKTNTYTEPQELLFSADVKIALAYNNAGTRGASHTCTVTISEVANSSVTAQEWDGIAASPTVASATATGISTAPSVSVAVSESSLAVGLVAHNGGATITPAGGATEASEQDEANVNQDQNVSYKTAQTGTPAIDWTLGASVDWGAIIVTFTEAAAVAGQPAMRRGYGIPGMAGFRGGWN